MTNKSGPGLSLITVSVPIPLLQGSDPVLSSIKMSDPVLSLLNEGNSVISLVKESDPVLSSMRCQF